MANNPYQNNYLTPSIGSPYGSPTSFAPPTKKKQLGVYKHRAENNPEAFYRAQMAAMGMPVDDSPLGQWLQSQYANVYGAFEADSLNRKNPSFMKYMNNLPGQTTPDPTVDTNRRRNGIQPGKPTTLDPQAMAAYWRQQYAKQPPQVRGTTNPAFGGGTNWLVY